MTTELGRKYRDIVTGFEGVAVARTTYLNGCDRIALEFTGKAGKPDSAYFDEPNLVDVGEENVLTKIGSPSTEKRRSTGGPHDHGSLVR